MIGKTLIIVRGLHNKDNNNNGPIDWKLCYKSLFDNFIFFLDSKNYDIYFQTYYSPELDVLKEYYKPIKYICYPLDNINHYTQTDNIYQTLQIIDNIKQYDSIFITRFDILYKIPLNKWNIKENRINVYFRQPTGQINDVVFFLYLSNLDEFTNKIKNSRYTCSLHDIKFDNLHSMSSTRYYSDTDYPEYFPLNKNPFYILHRKRRWGFNNQNETYLEAKRQGWIK